MSALLAWIGQADLNAAAGRLKAGPGPIAQAVRADHYESIHLLSDYSASESNAFIKWLRQQTDAGIALHAAKLSSPVNFGEIYERAVEVLKEVNAPPARLTFHLSPGTSAMASVWILLAKTTFPARLIQSSQQAGVEEVNVPFDIAAEFIPQLLQRSDERLTALSMAQPVEDAAFDSIVHRSAVMKRVVAYARRVAVRNIPVLIEGESGTGKELMARAIHRASRRADGAFIAVNCGAIPAELVESEFFGHMKGAFTGAIAHRKGHFEIANGGTIFLDEVGELPKPIQVKLLRVLQEGEVTAVGASEARRIDVRVIAATNRTLIDEVAHGNFREDLFYRLAVLVIRLPPLRERAGDVSLLIDAMMEQVNDPSGMTGIPAKRISAAARNLLLQHEWRGNVREVLSTLQRAAVWSEDDTIGPEAIRNAIMQSPRTQVSAEGVLNRTLDSGIDLQEIMADVARHYLQRAMEQTNSNRSQAAKLLGFANYQTFNNWLKRYGSVS